MKKLIAIIMVLVIAVGCVACNVEKTVTENLPPKGTYIDSNGIPHDVFQDADGNMYYEDEDGNKQIVSEDEVIPEAEFIESEEQQLEMTDDLVENEIVTDTNSAAKTEAENRMKTYAELLKSNQYTIRGTMKQMDGSVTEFPLIYVRNNSDFYIEAEVPYENGKAMKASVIYMSGTTYCYIPSMKVYYVLDDGENIGDDFGTGTFSDETINKFVFVESGTVTINNTQYTCDVYDFEGETHKYYYDKNGSLVRIEEIYSEKKYTILEVKGMSNKPDTSKIKKPTGIDITDMM